MKKADNRQLAVSNVLHLKRRPLLLFLLVTFSICHLTTCISAQTITASATLDTNAILIGQQTKLTLRVDYKTDQGEIKIEFPKMTDTIIKEIEIVSKSKVERFIPDSSDMSVLAQIQTIIITSFDSGYYAIPPFVFLVNGDRTETEPILFAVNTVPVDTTQSIMDIKPPLEIPFSWREYLPYVYWGLGGLGVLAAAILLIRKYLKGIKKIPSPAIIALKIPPHVTALESLEKLKEEKLWQQGMLKQYHSGLADIIRQYIEHRFYINAMEQVTDEILYSFRTVDLNEEQKLKLRGLLLLSDLVKFAKEQPLPFENEASWLLAYEFVISTKKDEVQEIPGNETASKENSE